MRYRPRKLRREITPDREKLIQLSVREMEVFSLLVSGKSNKEIAHDLYISPHTVKSHVAHIYAALDLKNRTDAAVFWMKTLQED